jgi:hypothetical protein
LMSEQAAGDRRLPLAGSSGGVGVLIADLQPISSR